MAKPKKPLQANRPRKSAKPNQYITKSGTAIKLNRSLADRMKSRRDARELRRAELLRDLPKSRLKRTLYRLHPKRVYKYWFSREGAVMALKVTGVGIVVVFVLMIGVFAYFRKDLPNLKDISGNNIGGSIRYFDKTGQNLLWEDYDAVKRIPVHDDQISQYIKDASVAVEDRDFYKHGGFDMKGIVRAGVANVTGGETSQGGSTITQQLVKLTQDWTKDRSYTRKVKELILSIELERSYSKEQILTGYLNAAPYGNIQYGVEVAARDYFQKSAKDLTLDEAAFLAAIPKSPSYYSPYGAYFDNEMLQGRMDYVLDVMHEMGKIDAKQRDEAKEIDVVAKVKKAPPKYGSIKAPYFVLAAKEQLEGKFTSQTYNRGGWKVTTTLDLNLQTIAEEQVQKGLAQIKRQGGDTAAFTAEDVETGQIVAMVGGVDFSNPEYGQNNYSRIPLPPGSSYKPYDYAALIDNTTNFGAGSVLFDTQGVIPGYPCTNKAVPKQGGNCLWDYDLKYPGPVTLRYALGGSRNVPAVKAMLIAGIDKTIQTSNKIMNGDDPLGYGYKCYLPDTVEFIPENEEQCYASSAIGDGAYLKQDEHVHGYATLSRNGLYVPRTYILKIEDGNSKLIDEWKPSQGVQTVRPDTAYIINDMLSDPNASYFPAGRKPHRYKNWKFAMKTGTTNDAKDGWMMGYSSKYAAGVWVGYHTRRVEMRGTMEAMTQPIWEGWMRKAHDNLPPKDWAKPSSVQSLNAYVITSHVGLGSVEPSPKTDLFPAWYQNTKKTTAQSRVIDEVSKKLATECTPDRAKKTETQSSAAQFSGDTFVNANTQTDEKDDVHSCTDERPRVSLTIQTNLDGSYAFKATVTQGTHPLSSEAFPGTVTFRVNGEAIPNGTVGVSQDGQTVEVIYSPAQNGNYEVSAEVVDSVLYDGTDRKTGVTLKPKVAGAGAAPTTTNDKKPKPLVRL